MIPGGFLHISSVMPPFLYEQDSSCIQQAFGVLRRALEVLAHWRGRHATTQQNQHAYRMQTPIGQLQCVPHVQLQAWLVVPCAYFNTRSWCSCTGCVTKGRTQQCAPGAGCSLATSQNSADASQVSTLCPRAGSTPQSSQAGSRQRRWTTYCTRRRMSWVRCCGLIDAPPASGMALTPRRRMSCRRAERRMGPPLGGGVGRGPAVPGDDDQVPLPGERGQPGPPAVRHGAAHGRGAPAPEPGHEPPGYAPL